jgi:hypothetical protein
MNPTPVTYTPSQRAHLKSISPNITDQHIGALEAAGIPWASLIAMIEALLAAFISTQAQGTPAKPAP